MNPEARLYVVGAVIGIFLISALTVWGATPIDDRELDRIAVESFRDTGVDVRISRKNTWNQVVEYSISYKQRANDRYHRSASGSCQRGQYLLGRSRCGLDWVEGRVPWRSYDVNGRVFYPEPDKRDRRP